MQGTHEYDSTFQMFTSSKAGWWRNWQMTRRHAKGKLSMVPLGITRGRVLVLIPEEWLNEYLAMPREDVADLFGRIDVRVGRHR